MGRPAGSAWGRSDSRSNSVTEALLHLLVPTVRGPTLASSGPSQFWAVASIRTVRILADPVPSIRKEDVSISPRDQPACRHRAGPEGAALAQPRGHCPQPPGRASCISPRPHVS